MGKLVLALLFILMLLPGEPCGTGSVLSALQPDIQVKFPRWPCFPSPTPLTFSFLRMCSSLEH